MWSINSLAKTIIYLQEWILANILCWLLTFAHAFIFSLWSSVLFGWLWSPIRGRYLHLSNVTIVTQWRRGEGSEVKLKAVLISTLHQGECATSHLGRVKPQCKLGKGLDERYIRSGWWREYFLSLQGIVAPTKVWLVTLRTELSQGHHCYCWAEYYALSCHTTLQTRFHSM